MNIRLCGSNINTHNFTEQKLTLFILDCLLNRSNIDCQEGNVFGSTKLTFRFNPLPARGYYATPEQAEVFYQGVEVTSSEMLKTLYEDLKHGRFLDFDESMIDGVVINIMQDSIEHPNAMVVALDFKRDRIVEFIAATGYRELNSIKRGFAYRPFHGTPFHITSDFTFGFLDDQGRNGVSIRNRNIEIHYGFAKMIANGEEQGIPAMASAKIVRASLLSLEMNKVLVNLLEDNDQTLSFLSNWTTSVFDNIKDFKQLIPIRYHDNPEVNKKFDQNVDTFIKEYGSIAATALRKARLQRR